MSVARDFYSRDSKTPSLVHVFALESRFQVLRHISRLQARGTPRGRAEGSRGRPRVGERQKSECGRHEREHVAVLGRGRGHHGRVEGHVRRRWAPACVDARADARELTRSFAVVPPHHGPQSPRRPFCTAAAAAAAPSSRSSEAVCAFSARARPFSLRLVSPRGALPLPSPFPLGARLRLVPSFAVKSGF